MTGMSWWLGVMSVAVAALLLLWRRSRAETVRLRRALQSSAGDLERLQLSFARFAPQQVIERIITKGVATTADRNEVTVMFADIVGFTRLSEGLDPKVLVDILNGYFTRMSRVIADHRGHVSKFIGDGILALFGALERNPWQVNDAVQAALAMQAELRSYNVELKLKGLPELRVGIGIHCGPVVAGIVGSSELVEFTVIGPTVNVAARVEHLTRVFDVDIVVTEAVRAVLDARFQVRTLPATAVAGVSEPLVTHAVIGIAPAPSLR